MLGITPGNSQYTGRASRQNVGCRAVTAAEIAASFALLDTDDHAAAVDVADLVPPSPLEPAATGSCWRGGCALTTSRLSHPSIHPSSVPVSREHRRAKTDRLDTELHKRAFLVWLGGEPESRGENLTGERTRNINRIKATLVRLGICKFNPKVRLDTLRSPKAPHTTEHVG
jgi:hypothetical protein